MKKILIVMDKTPFGEGLVKLIELHFGKFYQVMFTEPNKINQIVKETNPKLIILEQVCDTSFEILLLRLKQQGSKIVLLSSEPDIIQDYLEQDLFDGLLVKNMPTKQLLEAIEGILQHDEVYVDPKIGYLLLKKIQNSNN